MLQVTISGGEVAVVEVPPPSLRSGGALVRTSHSLISAGTESAGMGGGGQENLLLKAIRNPDLVRKVVDKAKSQGWKSTADLVRDRLSRERASGYSCAGVVLESSPDVTRFRPGDRVACCGAGYANHAGVNFIPQNLLAHVPEAVSLQDAAFGTLGAIALQGVRRCAPQLGDRVVVLGLGLLGQLTAQLLQASGAYVIGVDIRKDRVDRACSLGMQAGFSSLEREFAAGVLERTDDKGADAVIITAAGGDASLLNRSFDACRRKGRVVLVGDVPIRIQRDKIYRKELDFLVSTSYGPGRYDPEYEEKGHDYPYAYVRWTEGRNLEEAVRLISTGDLAVKDLTDCVFPIEQAVEAYASLASEARPIGVLLDYHLDQAIEAQPSVYIPRRRAAAGQAQGKKRIGVIGYGNYFRAVLLPLLRAHSGFHLRTVCDREGLLVRSAVERDGFERGTTDYREVISDPEIDAVCIATRHNQHFPLASEAVRAGKAVWVEKPMTMTSAEGRQLADLVAQNHVILTVGFNRRFSPHSQMLKQSLASVAASKVMWYRVNAGPLPQDHWLLDPVEGGGRLLGEGVHFFDFLTFLAGSAPVRVRAVSPGGHSRDEAVVTMEFADGSVGTLLYSGSGSTACGKERVEIFGGGATFVLDDFRTLSIDGMHVKGMKTAKIQKGQKEQVENFFLSLRGEADIGVTAEDGYNATWCAEQALMAVNVEA